MSETDFNDLSIRQKADIVWEWGYFAGSRKSATHTIVLFLIGDFFCEVFFNSISNKTEEINSISVHKLKLNFPEILEANNPLVNAAISKISVQRA